MIYRNSDRAAEHEWVRDTSPDSGPIACEFLAGELDLLRFTNGPADVIAELATFLDSATGLSLAVDRAATGEILISAGPWAESLLLDGRTADVLRAYLDREVVRMEDRFDMTVRGVSHLT